VDVNTIFVRKSALLLSGLAALAVAGNTLAANAQTIQPEVSVETTEAQQLANPEETTATNPVVNQSTFTILPSFELPATQQIAEFNLPNPPETVAISTTPATSQTSATPVAQPNQIAQSDIEVGRTTRGGSSYLGVGLNIGLNGGSSALGDGNFITLQF
jgi:hypothetical protein